MRLSIYTFALTILVLLAPSISLAQSEYDKGIAAYSKKEYSQARSHWEDASADGNISATFNLGILLSKGLGGDKDLERATNLFRRAADAGLAAAQHNMALAYYQGIGVTKNADRAKIWWERAAHQDHAQAQFNLGALLWNGDGVPKHPSNGLKWFRKSSKNGNLQARVFLDQIFEKMSLEISPAEGADDSTNLATKQIAASTELTNALAAAHAAYKDKNYKVAYKNWSYAASNGHFGAQYQLARLHQAGLGTDEDNQRAFELFKTSAEAGQAQSQYQLGQYYLEGDLVDKNETLALYWIQSAADQNDIMAKDYLEQIR